MLVPFRFVGRCCGSFAFGDARMFFDAELELGEGAREMTQRMGGEGEEGTETGAPIFLPYIPFILSLSFFNPSSL